MRRAHLREIMAALRAAREKQPPAPAPDPEPPKALVEAGRRRTSPACSTRRGRGSFPARRRCRAAYR